MSQQPKEDIVSWRKILDELQLEVAPSAYHSVFSRTSLSKQPTGEWEVVCSNDGVRFLLETKYKKLVLDKLKHHSNGDILSVKIVAGSTTQNSRVSLGPLFPDPAETREARFNRSHINTLLTFDNFAVSVSNQIAHAAAQAVAQQPGRVYSPLFLWGGVGVGKTHLLHAIGGVVLKETPLHVLYCSAEEFTNALVDAIRSKSSNLFRKKFRSVDVLLVDDIQFVSQREFVQEELFNTFNALYTAKRQIVFASDKPPRALQHVEERLASRFLSGLVVDIGRPDFELKTAILLIKARQKKINIDVDGAKIISAGIDDIREIEGFLMRLRANYGEGVYVPPQDLQKLLIPTTSAAKTFGPKEIMRIVSQETGVSVKDMRGEVRKKNIAAARHMCMYLLKTHSQMTYEDIAAFIGKKDHTTVMYAVQKIVGEVSQNDSTRRLVERIRLYFS